MALSGPSDVPRLLVMSFWPTTDHWSVEIPLDTPHTRRDVRADDGVAILTDAPFEVPESEFLSR